MTFRSAKFQKPVRGLHGSVRWLWQYRAVPAILALASVAMLNGCAGVVDASGPKTSSPTRAAIQVTPGNLNFGSTVVGKKVSQPVTVANTGKISVTLSKANLSSSQFSVSGLALPLTLPAGQSSNFQVWFDATSAGNVTGSFTVQTDTGVSSAQVALAGTAMAPPQINASSTSLNLGSATIGTTATGTLTLTNAGGTNLLISLISVTGGSFGVSGISTPSTVTPGSSVTLNVSFSPAIAGSATGSISVTSNDPQNPTTTVTLTGAGTSTPVSPSITTSPVNQTVTAGQTATFTVVAAGTAPLSYQWRKNGVNIAGATAASYTTPATTTSDSGSTFGVVVSNTVGTVTSATATLTVSAAPVGPSITTSPTNQTVTAGQTATFTAVAAGTAPLSYQWQKNGANIAGATAASYTTPVTTTSDSGSTFGVVVSNTVGTVTSATATLTVSAAPVGPSITTSPTNQTVTAGQTATFTAVAAGTAPLSYQWQKNGANIAGATAASYTTPVTTTSDSGSTFGVVVSNTVGTVASATATLTVSAAPVGPSITTSPTNQTVTAGQTATFTAVAAGTAPLSYQWQKNGVNIAGANGSELHHAGDNHLGQRIDIWCSGKQHGGHSGQCNRDADGERCAGRALDHNFTHESDRDGRADCNLHGGCGGDSSAQLPMAEKRREHRRSYRSELHHAGDNHLGQRIDIWCSGKQHGGHSGQCNRDADGERCAGRAFDHNFTHESDRDGRADCNLHGGCGGDSSAQLPMAEKRREHRRS